MGGAGKLGFLVGLAALILAAPACGIRSVEGHYVGTATGSVTILGLKFPTGGDINFDLVPAGADLFSAAGNLIVKRQSDGTVAYEATLSGSYAGGSLSLDFTAKDGKSSGTMRATTLAGTCWNGGTWTISGLATSGSGTWSACR